MAKMTAAQWRQYDAQWRRAAPELDRVRREELAHWKYDWRIVDALLDIGAKTPRREEKPNGLVEMQKWFIKLARRQGLVPLVREGSAACAAIEKRAGLDRPGDASGLVYTSAPIPPGPKLALFCSVKCPGKLILDTYDLVQHLRELGVTVISGFHSPMEQECLRILLRSPHPVIWCLARGRLQRVPAQPVDCRQAVADGRLLLVSPFPDKLRHITAKTAMMRTRMVAELAAAVIVAHAAPGSKMEKLCQEILAAGKPLYTFDHPANAALLQAGAKPILPGMSWKFGDIT